MYRAFPGVSGSKHSSQELQGSRYNRLQRSLRIAFRIHGILGFLRLPHRLHLSILITGGLQWRLRILDNLHRGLRIQIILIEQKDTRQLSHKPHLNLYYCMI
jgi:hypothetical protein